MYRTIVAATAAGLAVAGLAVPTPARAAAVWSAPVTLAAVDPSTSPTLTTAGQASGVAVVVWTDGGQARASVHPSAAAGWSSAVTLSPAEAAWSLTAAVRPDGAAVVAWAARRSADAVIKSSTWTASAGWGAPVVVSRTGLTSAGPVQLAVDGSGRILAAWGQADGAGVVSVTSAELAPAGAWTAPSTIATPTATGIRQISVAVNASGAAAIGWVRQYGGSFGDVTTRGAGGSFGTPVTIANGPARPLQLQLHSVKVAVDAAGRTSAAWNTGYVYAGVLQPDGAWATPVEYPVAYTTHDPALVVDTTGSAVLLWSVTQVMTSSLPPGGSWSEMSTPYPGQVPIFLSMTANGADEYAGWLDGATREITAVLHTPAGWDSPVQVGAAVPDTAWMTGLSTAPVGSGALVAWISGAGNPGSVQVVSTTGA